MRLSILIVFIVAVIAAIQYSITTPVEAQSTLRGQPIPGYPNIICITYGPSNGGSISCVRN